MAAIVRFVKKIDLVLRKSASLALRGRPRGSANGACAKYGDVIDVDVALDVDVPLNDVASMCVCMCVCVCLRVCR